MRGSPLLRFFLLTLALCATAVGLARVTTSRLDKPITRQVDDTPSQSLGLQSPYRLILSAPASEIQLEAMAPVLLKNVNGIVSGTLQLDPKNPALSLIIRWKNSPAAGEHRFAKLILEPPGQATFVHVFDDDADIDDFLEIPLPIEK